MLKYIILVWFLTTAAGVVIVKPFGHKKKYMNCRAELNRFKRLDEKR
ncbi:hypothetical protein HBE96_05080 [Clostridium sp. P21]|uniref:Uncharacterized protein n=1 Tax=Clostridium muellerianum TaxID=2716538 RepID=A0A7Y0HMX9_9CLOT|nr:hypothetical protein [Clostridium muellerianum]NMM62072.1 hypothetical protein [Clostridium muellerianum]